MAMIRVGVRELMDGLSRALRQVREGETVEVTDHGRPIARIVKAWPSRAQQMIAEGRLMPPEMEGDLLDLWPPPALEPGERLGSEILAELRADER
jgi:prevent-host-death family protein